VSRPEDLTAAVLGRLLAGRGRWKHAAPVRLVERGRRAHLFSMHARYDAAYRGPEPHPPTRLLLKLPRSQSDSSREMLAHEARFYRAWGDDPDLPLVRWLAANDREHPFVLLEDLSDTHMTPPGPEPADRRQAESMLEALARFHARWWEDPSLGRAIGERWDDALLATVHARIEADYARFLGVVGDALSPGRRAVYDAALAAWPALARRLLGIERLTLIHGDAHSWNCLFPKAPDRHPAYLVDLSTCRIRTPANDLAYMMALKWGPDLRRRWELPLLRHYHQRLAERVGNYGWDQLWWDYRFAAIIHLFTPVHQAAGGQVPATNWRHDLERILQAFDDLDCRELL
jgi:hypothetical protein